MMIGKQASRSVVFVLATAACLHQQATTDAFSVVHQQQQATRSANAVVALNLLPTQAAELVAHAYKNSDENHDDDNSVTGGVDGGHYSAHHRSHHKHHQHQSVMIASDSHRPNHHNKALSFVSRVLQFTKVYANTPDGDGKDGGDVVLFPVTGCRLVVDAPDHFRALPTHKQSHPACRIPTRIQREEVLYGWFRPPAAVSSAVEDDATTTNDEVTA